MPNEESGENRQPTVDPIRQLQQATSDQLRRFSGQRSFMGGFGSELREIIGDLVRDPEIVHQAGDAIHPNAGRFARWLTRHAPKAAEFLGIETPQQSDEVVEGSLGDQAPRRQ